MIEKLLKDLIGIPSTSEHEKKIAEFGKDGIEFLKTISIER